MKKLHLMNDLVKKTIHTKLWFILFPFTIVAAVLVLAYYITCSLYLLFDLLTVETKEILKKDSEDECNGVQVVKHLMGFFFVVCFNFITIGFSLTLGVLYYFTVCFNFVGSLGRVKVTPFGFHTL